MGRPIVLFSCAGYGNLGDYAMLSSVMEILRRLRPESPLVHVIGPEQQVREPDGISTIRYKGSLSGIARVFPLLLRSEALVLIGGSVVHDHYPYAARRWLRMGWLGRISRIRTVFIGAGIYEPTTKAFDRAMKRFCRGPIRFLPREERSVRLLQRFGARHIDLIADPVFALKVPSECAEEPSPNRGIVGVNVRPYPARDWQGDLSTERLCSNVAHVLNILHERQDARFRYFAFSEAAGETDQHCYQLLREKLQPTIEMEFVPYEEAPSSHLEKMAGMDLLIAMRLHALTFGILAGVSCVGISYEPKVDELFAKMELSTVVPRDFSPEDLLDAVQKAQRRTPEAVKRQSDKVRQFAASVEEGLCRALAP